MRAIILILNSFDFFISLNPLIFNIIMYLNRCLETLIELSHYIETMLYTVSIHIIRLDRLNRIFSIEVLTKRVQRSEGDITGLEVNTFCFTASYACTEWFDLIIFPDGSEFKGIPVQCSYFTDVFITGS